MVPETPAKAVGFKLEDGFPGGSPVKRVAKKEKEESDDEMTGSPWNGPGRGKGQPTAKALKAREKALADKFEIVQANIGNKLETTDGVVVDCFYNGNSKSAPMNKQYDYTHLLKLRSDQPFNLVNSVLLTEGEYAGNVAIIFKQSKPFPFMSLPTHIRAKILDYMITPPDGTIRFNMKQGGNKIAYAPGYTAKNRLAILRTCTTIYEEALPILYSQVFHFPGTQVIAAFLLQIGSNRQHLQYIRSDAYNGQSARTVFHLLQEAKDLKKISFAHVSSNEQPKTAIKNIYNDAHVWMLGLSKTDPYKGIKILSFDSNAFHMRERDEEGNQLVIQWGPAEQILFLKGLKQKLDQGFRRLG